MVKNRGGDAPQPNLIFFVIKGVVDFPDLREL
jgi:hypothetical protein